jgi:hypothetical protein
VTLVLLALLACGPGAPPDPRPAIVRDLGAAPPPASVPAPSAVEERVLLGQIAAACAGLRARVVAEGLDEDWRMLLLAAARVPAQARTTGGCLTEALGSALATWGEGKPRWRGPRAEWKAALGDGDALAILGERGDDAARLRIALAKGDGDAARFAAEGALVEEPRDVLACRIVGLAALAEGDLAWAIETSACGGLGPRAPELLRIRAEALDRAGEFEAAAAAYAAAGLDVHRAAILYQESPTPERLAEAAHLLAPDATGRPPPAALHGLWMALLHGGEPSTAGLDASVPAGLARAMASAGGADVTALAALPGAQAAVVRARVAAAQGDRLGVEDALADALTAEPAGEPVHRARVAIRLLVGGDVGGALADWAAQDPDHVAAVGTRGSRDMPWAALVPETWGELAARRPDPRMRSDAPSGADAIGSQIRTARAISEAGARSDAFSAVLRVHPGLDGLVLERYQSAPSVASVSDRDP